MKDKKTSQHIKAGAYILLGAVFLLLVILNVFFQIHWLDSDMAAEMMFSKLLAEEGHIFATPRWYYSTEFRILYTQLIMGPLFHVTDNWHWIRTITNIVFYLLLLGSYLYFVKPFGIKRHWTALTSVILLLPFSETMMTHMQMGNTYMPHVVLIFLFFGMFLRLAGGTLKKGRRFEILIFYFALGIVCGVSGIRYLLALQCPLLLTAALFFCRSESFGAFRREMTKEHWRRIWKSREAGYLGYSALGAFAGVLGYGINVLYVSRQYVFQTYDATNFIALYQGVFFERLQNAFGCLLMLFGYIPDKGFLSLRGLVTLASFVILAVLIYCCRRVYRLRRRMEADGRFFTVLFLAVAFALNVFVFVFTTSTMVPRYYITLFIFTLPVLAFYMEEKEPAFDRAAVAVLLGGCLLLATTKTVFSFIGTDKNEDKYQVAAFLKENGYHFGFATYTNGNIITEITNGAVEIGNVNGPEYLEYFTWSSPMKYYEEDYHDGEVFLLLTLAEETEFAEAKSLRVGERVYGNESYAVYLFESRQQLKNSAVSSDRSGAGSKEVKEQKTEMKMKVQVGDAVFTATLAENSSVDALKELMEDGPLTLNMSDYANMEKGADLGVTLPQNNEQMNTRAGDIILYQGRTFVIYYDTNSWSLTPIGKIDNVDAEELRAVLGTGDVTVTLSIE